MPQPQRLGWLAMIRPWMRRWRPSANFLIQTDALKLLHPAKTG
jgi:hypothetical protein